MDVEIVRDRRTIVTALPLKRRARERLAELLQARIVDIRSPGIDNADLVLTPVCSPQLIGRLKARFVRARVVVVELDDWDFDIELPGPVKRLLSNGVDAYLLADSLEELAAKIAAPAERADALSEAVRGNELPAAATVDELIDAFLRESIEYSVRHNQH